MPMPDTDCWEAMRSQPLTFIGMGLVGVGTTTEGSETGTDAEAPIVEDSGYEWADSSTVG